MTQQRTTLWNRTTKTLGRWIAGMVTLPEDRRFATAKQTDRNDYPRFPAF
jgi:hypothetical protein